MNSEAKRRVKLLVGISAALTVASAGFVFAVAAPQGGDPESGTTSDPPVSPPCDEIGITELELGVATLDAPAVSCFTVTENVHITIGARGPEYSDLIIEVRGSDGDVWDVSDDAADGAPVVSTMVVPGSYIVTVSDRYTLTPEGFTLYSLIRDPSVPWGGVNTVLPFLSECGSASVPLLEPDSDYPLANATRYSCVVLDTNGFVKVGAIADDGNTADFNLAIHSFDQSGQPQFIRSVNDTFGTDPEISLELEAGPYLIEMAETMGAPLGGFSVYIDTTESFFRHGDVSPPLESLTASDCVDGTLPTLALGISRRFSAGESLSCVIVSSSSRLLLDVTSLAHQDLTLEVVGFNENGLPVRFGWVDDDLWATSFDDYDPRLDIILPSGTFILAIDVVGDGVVGDSLVTIAKASS